MKQIGAMLLVLGGVTVAVGLILLLTGRFPFLGKLPGDIQWKGNRGSFFFPVTTCLVISIVLTVVLNLLLRLFRR